MNENVNQCFTEEQIAEYVKCKNDIVYFVEKYINVCHLDNCIRQLQLRDYQKNLLKELTGESKTNGIDYDRQFGVSLMMEILCLHTATFKDFQSIGFCSHKKNHFKLNFDRIKLMHSKLPNSMRKKIINEGILSIEFENGSCIDAGFCDPDFYQSRNFNLLVIDNAGLISDEQIGKLCENVLPIIQNIENSKIVFCVTGDKMSRLLRKIFRKLNYLAVT